MMPTAKDVLTVAAAVVMLMASLSAKPQSDAKSGNVTPKVPVDAVPAIANGTLPPIEKPTEKDQDKKQMKLTDPPPLPPKPKKREGLELRDFSGLKDAVSAAKKGKG